LIAPPMRCRAATPEDTEAFGERLARHLPAGKPFAVIYLTGDLGAGKTTLARGFLRACGVQGPVRSPTYTLVEAYDAGDLTLLHLDLYRLRDPSELEPLGLREWARPGHVWLIEWPERGEGGLPQADLTIALHAAADAHEIAVEAHTAAGRQWLTAVAT